MDEGSAPLAAQLATTADAERLSELALMFDLSKEEMGTLEEIGEEKQEESAQTEQAERQLAAAEEDLFVSAAPFPDLQGFKGGQVACRAAPISLSSVQLLAETPLLPALPELPWVNDLWSHGVGKGGMVVADHGAMEPPLLTVAPIASAIWEEELGREERAGDYSWIEMVPGATAVSRGGNIVWHNPGLPAAQRLPGLAVRKELLSKEKMAPEVRDEGEQSKALAASEGERLQMVQHFLLQSAIVMQQIKEWLAQSGRQRRERPPLHKAQRRRLELRHGKRPRRRSQGARARRQQTFAAALRSVDWVEPWQGWLDGVSQRVKEQMIRVVSGARDNRGSGKG
ncbi:hypothetical protein [Candidatus Magnetaquicoccus inordinatus]|uniref:hypothetical protein n=1 Tax=Candidatus Magnetaquicoccus inordinatus TaxID=2496818 RepID=UPI00102AEE34|nr:hypothetical protein [Candidatus Magnetaquicoccus inordinatus]